jgi:hypothetical protein
MLDNKGYKHALRICNIYCFPLQQCLRERASMLRCMYTACLAYLSLISVSISGIVTGPAETGREIFCCLVGQHILLGDLTFDGDCDCDCGSLNGKAIIWYKFYC